MYHGFINLFRLWFPNANWFWNYLPVVEEYVVSHQLIVLTICLLMTLIFFRNSILQTVNAHFPNALPVLFYTTIASLFLISATLSNLLATIRRMRSKLLRK